MAGHVAYVADLVLVDRCKEGEEAAARELFRLYHRRVYNTLYRLLGNTRDMDDLIQGAFIQVFKSLHSFRAECKLSTWIDRITVRTAYRYISRRKPPLLCLDEVDEPVRLADSPKQQASSREGVRRLYQALSELPSHARIAFALHEIDGRSVAEVAALVGVSKAATKLRIWRARRALFKLAAADPILAEFLTEEST